MKKTALLLAVPFVFAMAACEQKPKTTTEQVKDKVDRRPNEKLKDAAEDIRDGAKSAVKDLKEAGK